MTNPLFEHAVHNLLTDLDAPAAERGARKKRAVSNASNLWRPGQTLRIAFMGKVEPAFKSGVFSVARQWLAYANLSFELAKDNDADADVQIATNDKGLNSSNLGSSGQQGVASTMTLGCRPGDELFEVIVLHEFGHILGMKHEHQHPQANIPWDLDRVVEKMANRVTQARPELQGEALLARIEHVIEENYLPVTGATWLLPYDKHSIMHYSVNQQDTIGDWELERNTVISEGDKAFMRLVYPGR